MGIFNATSTYGQGFKPTKEADVYKIKIYTGGFAGEGTATDRAEEEIDKYLEKSSTYTQYEIVNTKRIWFPFSCFEFTVKYW